MVLVVGKHQKPGGRGENSSFSGICRSGVDYITQSRGTGIGLFLIRLGLVFVSG